MKNIKPFMVGHTATALVVSLAATPALHADENPFQAQEIQRPAGSEQKLAQGMCGGSCGGNWEGRCGGMMGGTMPPALGPAQLPEPDSAGAKLLTQFCTQCHNLPSPKQHSASGWSVTLARMNMRMQWMSQNQSAMNIAAPSEDELRTLSTYLERNATDPDATALTNGSTGSGPGGEVVSPARKTAIEILRERYARGEIDRKEFLEKRDVLEK